MIREFLSTHPDFDFPLERALYVHNGDETYYIIEEPGYKDKRKCYMFKYFMGYFSECKTEINAFDKYFALIPGSYHSEYIVLS